MNSSPNNQPAENTKSCRILSQTNSEQNITPAEERERKLPIPPPSDAKQYRAIGLIKGQYQRSAEQMTKGRLLSDRSAIEAVLLGRAISIVKNHLDLAKPHLWVVYPRTRQKDEGLHVQIVGVWEPETLNPNKVSLPPQRPPESEHGYFSVRGEVIFYSQASATAIVKIKQSPKKESDKPKFFKIKLIRISSY